MRFADIPGHEDTKRRLREMVHSGRLPHALLLEGIGGVGKFALARALAQYIHCSDRTPDGDSCGRCPACLQHRGFNHIDTVYSFPVFKIDSKATFSDDYAREFQEYMRDCVFADFSAWSGAIANGKTGQASIFVDEASLLIERVSHTAHSKGYKVVLMWLPERLRPEAANRLLKLIEEPPDDTVFIMTSDRPGEILGTIYSRTQRVTVNRYTEDEIVGYLCAHAGADPAAAGAAAVLADGSMAAALQLLSVDKERAMFLELFIRLMRLAWMRKIVPLREWSQEVAALGRDGSARFYGYCSRMLRENFILNVSGDNNLVTLTADEAAFSSKFCPYVNERNIVQLIEAVDEAIRDTRLNGNAKIISFDLAVRAILLLKR